MAERSFASEVHKLTLGEGQEFRGEGILAITKALLQSGVGYVGGYQGAPISHLMDVLSDAQDLLAQLGVQFSASASEAAAAASLAASIMYPIRGAVVRPTSEPPCFSVRNIAPCCSSLIVNAVSPGKKRRFNSSLPYRSSTRASASVIDTGQKTPDSACIPK